jgi:Glycosyl transferase family 2
VIPTLGGETLRQAIAHLNAGTLVPAEILICIPTSYAERISWELPTNARVVPTECKGQVAQRAEGFKQAKHSFVLQLDDDVHLESDCLQVLLVSLKQNSKCAVWYDIDSGKHIRWFFSQQSRENFLSPLLLWLIFGTTVYRPGTISPSGVPMVLPEHNDYYNVEWLAGGCVLHHRNLLIFDNFYPFPGKAYSEDLFHSTLLRAAGVCLARIGSAKCFTRTETASSDKMISEAILQARAASNLVRLTGGNVGKAYLSQMVQVASRFLLRLLRHVEDSFCVKRQKLSPFERNDSTKQITNPNKLFYNNYIYPVIERSAFNCPQGKIAGTPQKPSSETERLHKHSKHPTETSPDHESCSHKPQ